MKPRLFALGSALVLSTPLHCESFVPYQAGAQSVFGGISNERRGSYADGRPETSLKISPVVTTLTDTLSAYSFALEHYQIQTETATGGLLCGIGDILAQSKELYFKETKNVYNNIARGWDTRRAGQFVLKGLGGAIIWSYWYGAADEFSGSIYDSIVSDTGLLGMNINSEWLEPLMKTGSSIALEQFVWCPIVFSMWDIPLPSLLSGSPLRKIPGEVSSKLGGLLVANAKVWTFINLLIYNIPLEWRVVVSCVTDLFWQSIVSTIVFDGVTSASAEGEGEGDTLSGGQFLPAFLPSEEKA